MESAAVVTVRPFDLPPPGRQALWRVALVALVGAAALTALAPPFAVALLLAANPTCLWAHGGAWCLLAAQIALLLLLRGARVTPAMALVVLALASLAAAGAHILGGGYLGATLAFVHVVVLARAWRTHDYMYKLERDLTFVLPALPDRPDAVAFVNRSDPDGDPVLTLGAGRSVTVHAGYTWDGCTPKFSILGVMLFGTFDGVAAKLDTDSPLAHRPGAYFASMVHDALYQLGGREDVTKEVADAVFYQLLSEAQFPARDLYYTAVRVGGRVHRDFVQKTLRGAGLEPKR